MNLDGATREVKFTAVMMFSTRHLFSGKTFSLQLQSSISRPFKKSYSTKTHFQNWIHDIDHHLTESKSRNYVEIFVWRIHLTPICQKTQIINVVEHSPWGDNHPAFSFGEMFHFRFKLCKNKQQIKNVSSEILTNALLTFLAVLMAMQ